MIEVLTRSFSLGQRAIEMKVPEAMATEVIKRLRERGIEPKTQRAGGSEISIRVEKTQLSKEIHIFSPSIRAWQEKLGLTRFLPHP